MKCIIFYRVLYWIHQLMDPVFLRKETREKMRAKILKIQYVPGEYFLSQGHKGGERCYYKNGRYVKPTGCGWATESKPARLSAFIDVDGCIHETRLDFYFHNVWGRLTQKRITAIESTAPEYVNVEKQLSSYGNEYFTISDNDMDTWFQNAVAY